MCPRLQAPSSAFEVWAMAYLLNEAECVFHALWVFQAECRHQAVGRLVSSSITWLPFRMSPAEEITGFESHRPQNRGLPLDCPESLHHQDPT